MSAAMTNFIYLFIDLFPILLANVLFNIVMPKAHLSYPTDLASVIHFRYNYFFKLENFSSL